LHAIDDSRPPAGRAISEGCKVEAAPASADAIRGAHHITDRHFVPNGGYVAEA
jgi:hypothetical protein